MTDTRKASGQLVQRQARLQQTAEWLGATPIDHYGKSLLAKIPQDEPDLLVARLLLDTIRTAFNQGFVVQVCEKHEPTLSTVRAALSPEELTAVRFT